MPDRSFVVGVDVGGTNMQFGVVDASNRIVGRARAKTQAREGLDQVVRNIVEGIEAACRDAGAPPEEVAAVGIAAAGAIDLERGVVLDAPNLGWKDVPLRDHLRREIGRPVVLNNDVNGCAWGEYSLGAGRGGGDLLAVWVGTGVGGGLVLQGRVYDGPSHTAGEIGHVVLFPDGARGERTVEDVASRTGMSRRLRRLMPAHPDSALHALAPGEGVVSSDAFKEAYGEDDPLTRRVVDRAADLLGLAVANWVTVLSLGTVVIGGGITEVLGQVYLDRIRSAFEANVFPEQLRSCAVRMTELKADAGLLGAALMARG